MGRRKIDETRNAPLVCYTTETYKKDVLAYVEKNFNGLTLSTWLLNQIRTVIPASSSDEPKEELVGNHA